MVFTIYIIFLIFVSFYALFVAAVDDVKTFTFIGDDEGEGEGFSNQCPFGKDPQTVETSKDMLDCERRIWSATDPKGWTCAAPIPKNKLEYIGDIDVKYHDTIKDIKAQNPDPPVPLNLLGTNYYDVSNNIFQYKKAPAQNNMLFEGPGKYKYGYHNYTPKYHEAVVLSNLTDLANKELSENVKKLNDELNIFSDSDSAYNPSTGFIGLPYSPEIIKTVYNLNKLSPEKKILVLQNIGINETNIKEIEDKLSEYSDEEKEEIMSKINNKKFERLIELLRTDDVNKKYLNNNCRDFIIKNNRNTYTLHDIVKKEFDENRKYGIIYANNMDIDISKNVIPMTGDLPKDHNNIFNDNGVIYQHNEDNATNKIAIDNKTAKDYHTELYNLVGPKKTREQVFNN